MRPSYGGYGSSVNYFSIDNGTTNYRTFATSSDVSDWNGSVVNSFDASSYYGAEFDISAADYALMNVLGYHPTATTHIWAVNASGNWSGAANWVDYGAPNGVGILVQFNQATSAPRTITLDMSATAGTLSFDNAVYGYTVSGAQTLTMQTSSGNAAIQVLSGGHQISVNLSLASDTNFTVANNSSLNVSGSVSGAGSLAMLGPGLLNYSAAGTFAGNTSVTGGTLQVTAGRLPANNEYVGSGAGAYLVLSGGSNVVSDSLTIAQNAGDTGTCNIQGPVVLAVGTVGGSGRGQLRRGNLQSVRGDR